MNDSGRPVLVTGATGFLGSWTLAELVNNDRAVVACDLTPDTRRLDSLLPRERQRGIDWRTCDVTDTEALHRIVADVRPAAIIHLAALQIPACRNNPLGCAHVNIIGHINVFEAARRCGVERIIYTSSIASKPRGPDNAPANLYGVFKKTSEEIARIYQQEHDIPSLGLRPHIVYGVGRDDGETSAITRAMRAAATGETYTIPFNTRSCFQYAGEVADIFRRCSEARWSGALLSDLTTEVNSTTELLDAILSEVPDAAVTLADDPRVSPTDGFDDEPLKRVIGAWPHTSLVEGVRQTITRFRSLERDRVIPEIGRS